MRASYFIVRRPLLDVASLLYVTSTEKHTKWGDDSASGWLSMFWIASSANGLGGGASLASTKVMRGLLEWLKGLNHTSCTSHTPHHITHMGNLKSARPLLQPVGKAVHITPADSVENLTPGRRRMVGDLSAHNHLEDNHEEVMAQ